jgi:hypothetical protein
MKEIEQIIVMIPKCEWEEAKMKIDKLLENQMSQCSPLAGYATKRMLQDAYGFSDATWNRWKRNALFPIRKLGGIQFVKITNFIGAIEEGPP